MENIWEACRKLEASASEKAAALADLEASFCWMNCSGVCQDLSQGHLFVVAKQHAHVCKVNKWIATMPLAKCRPFGMTFSQSWRLHRKRCCNKLGSAVYFWVCGMSWDTMHFLNNEEPGCNEDWDIMRYIYIEIYMRSICIECFPEDTSTCQCHCCQDLPSMFGWKVRTAREAQQTSEEVRCSDYSDCVHCTRMHQFLLQRPRVRSCFWHGSISYDIWFIWCCTCERSNTHTQTHKHKFTPFKVVAFCAICNGYTQYRKMNLILCAWVWQGNLVIWCNMLFFCCICLCISWFWSNLNGEHLGGLPEAGGKRFRESNCFGRPWGKLLLNEL